MESVPMLCSHTSVENSTGSTKEQALDSVPALHSFPTILSHENPMSMTLPASTLPPHPGAMWSTKSMRKV